MEVVIQNTKVCYLIVGCANAAKTLVLSSKQHIASYGKRGHPHAKDD
jgi:hypothetical protein